ncbi:hypothetical protein Hanom_Chr03g00235341 [Helianthus anomalus]
MWRVADAEEKLAHEKHLNADRQKDWTAACERSNRELKAVCDETIRVNAERAKESKEFDRLSAMYKEKESEVLDAQKRNEEVRARIAELGKTVEEQQAQNKTLELLSQDLGDDCKWLLMCGVPLLFIDWRGPKSLLNICLTLDALFISGLKEGYDEGKVVALAKVKDDIFELFKVDCAGDYTAKCQEFEFIEFGILKAIDKLAQRGVAVETLKKFLDNSDAGTDGASSSHQP